MAFYAEQDGDNCTTGLGMSVVVRGLFSMIRYVVHRNATCCRCLVISRQYTRHILKGLSDYSAILSWTPGLLVNRFCALLFPRRV
jgi:hypothetical protein